jgi:hypothetical protein
MIISKYVDIIVNNKSVKYYKLLGYNIKGGDKINIPIEHLQKNSAVKVNVECSNCHSIQNITYQKYNFNIDRGGKYYCKHCNNITLKKTFNKKYNVNNPLQLEVIKNKIRKTVNERYGTDWISKLEFVKEKTKDTFIKKYGGHPLKNKNILNKILITKIKNKSIRCYDLNKFKDYKKRVINLTIKNRKRIFENWDGLDYYDNEYIKDNINLSFTDKLYPVVDHKISIIYGFKHNIDYNIISNIDNLCITKNYLNRLKGSKTEEEFKNKFFF